MKLTREADKTLSAVIAMKKACVKLCDDMQLHDVADMLANLDHVAVISAKPDSVHLAEPTETATETSLAPYDWKHWGGGACPVPMGTRVCIRFRDNSVFNNCDSAGIGWDHIGRSNGDIVAYRVESFAAESGISSLVGRPNEKDVVQEGKQ